MAAPPMRAAPAGARAGLHREPAGLGALRAWVAHKVLCTVSEEQSCTALAPGGSGEGWVTAEYSMLPAATDTPQRSRGLARQALRAHHGDPAPDRPQPARRRGPERRSSASARSGSTATCCRPMAARAPHRSPAPTPPWRWRAGASTPAATSSRNPLRDSVAGGLGGHRRRRGAAGPPLRGGYARRGRHERRRHGRRPLHRGAGDGGGRHILDASSSNELTAWRCAASSSITQPAAEGRRAPAS